jgi:plastocyanin
MRGRILFRVPGLLALALSVFLVAFVPGQESAPKQLAHQIMLIQEGGTAVVVPATQTVRPGDTVEFMAMGDDLTVFLAYKEFFGEERNTFEVLDGGSYTIKIMADQLKGAPSEPGPERDAYWKGLGLPRMVHYAAYSMEAHGFAVGHSSPVLLIEPPNGDD